jgi:single-stranded-DNA-specific exonuclease
MRPDYDNFRSFSKKKKDILPHGGEDSMPPQKQWVTATSDDDRLSRLTESLGLSPITAQVLVNRGIGSADEAKRFLAPSTEDLFDPFLLPDIEKAVDRITQAIQNQEPIFIYGDYDVDGVSATSLYLEVLQGVGARVSYYIPHRLKEGYGLNAEAIQWIAQQGGRLLITADCGTTSHQEIALANCLGISVIVTDHHEVPAELPAAYALINPLRSDSRYPFRGLCATGLAFKVSQALLHRNVGSEVAERLTPCLDLVTLATIADLVPLVGENRYFVKEGLARLSQNHRIGIRALKEAAGLSDAVGVGTVAFALGPRINAAGRLARADTGVRLLTSRIPAEAKELSEELNRANRERQQIEERVLNEAVAQIQQQGLEKQRTLVLASRDWHLGVVGIVASRIVERYHRPTVLIAMGPEGIGKGSARSIPAFHLYEALARLSHLLERFGGHKYAAGLAIQSERLGEFQEAFERVAHAILRPEDLFPRLKVDAEVEPAALTFRLISELEQLAPFGMANPEPTLAIRAVNAFDSRIVGQQHLKLKLRKPGALPLDAIGFRMGGRLNEVAREGCRMDWAFTPELRSLPAHLSGGGQQIQLRLKDFKACETQ